MKIEQATVVRHSEVAAGYRLLTFSSPYIAEAAAPGQFVHIQVPGLAGAVLRRPFSIFSAREEVVSILYKEVGKGTRAMSALSINDTLSVMGPLGNGFPLDETGLPVIVAGGYGMAPLHFFAERFPRPGPAFLGARTADAVLCKDDFSGLGWDVRVATDDGSMGREGLITDVLDAWLRDEPGNAEPVFYCCGPDALLRAVSGKAIENGWKAWLSLEKHMGCGVGACLACVQKIRRSGEDVEWGRVCKEGPVFESREIVWE